MKYMQRDLNVIAAEIDSALKRDTSNIFTIGKLLIEAKEQIGHGKWLSWLADNFCFSVSTAENYMSAARLTEKFPTIANLKLAPAAVYLLASRVQKGSISEEAIKKVFSQAELKWIDSPAIYDIMLSTSGETKTEEDEAERAEQEAAARTKREAEERAEAEALLDGSPPDLPEAPPPEDTVSARDQALLSQFEQGTKLLEAVMTSPAAKFATVEIPSDRLASIAEFLSHVVAKRVKPDDDELEALAAKIRTGLIKVKQFEREEIERAFDFANNMAEALRVILPSIKYAASILSALPSEEEVTPAVADSLKDFVELIEVLVSPLYRDFELPETIFFGTDTVPSARTEGEQRHEYD